MSTFKGLITQTYLNERLPYGQTKGQYRNIASICGTSNEKSLLVDKTGNRRWWVFEVNGIDSAKEESQDGDLLGINHQGIYSQALHLLKEGYKYWEEADEEMKEYEKQFEADSSEEDIIEETISELYRLPEKGEKGEFVSKKTMQEECSKACHGQRITPQKLNSAMQRLGYREVREWSIRGYYVCRVPKEK